MSEPVRPLADLPAWIARQVTGTPGGEGILPGIGRSLIAAGIPIRRVGFATRALNVSYRGLTKWWSPESAVETAYTAHGQAGDAAFERSPIRAALATGRERVRWNLARGEGAEIPRLARLRAEGCTEYLIDIVAFPPGTMLRGVGLFYVTDRPDGFTADDVAALRAVRDAFGAAVLGINLSYALPALLGTYLGRRAAGRVMDGGVRRGEGEVVWSAILLVDLKGFTALADREDPRRLVAWLDEHLDGLGREVREHGGEIFKFTGDGFIAAFPDAALDAVPCRACTGALAAARAGLRHNRALEAGRRSVGAPWLAADLALNFGTVVYGNVGTADRLDFTVIGRAVNEASRIETLCDVTRRNLLISDSFARRCAADLVDLGSFPLRGVAAPLRLWTVPEG